MGEDERKLIEELQTELAKLKVSDLLLQTLYSVSSQAAESSVFVTRRSIPELRQQLGSKRIPATPESLEP